MEIQQEIVRFKTVESAEKLIQMHCMLRTFLYYLRFGFLWMFSFLVVQES